MLSLVNYGSSDSEENISDEEDVIVDQKTQENDKKSESSENENDELVKTAASKISLPEPANHTKRNEIIEEDDDEFLHKKEVPEAAPPPTPKVKQKVKITIPKLSDFKDDEENTDSGPKYPTASNRKTGLLNMLPRPAHSTAPMNKPSISVPLKTTQPTKNTEQPAATSATSSSNSQQGMKKVGLIPYAMMDHRKKSADDSKKSASKRKPQDSDSDEEAGSSFFSFDTKIEDLPKVSEDEIKAMVDKERARIEERRKRAEEPVDAQYEEDYSQYYQQYQAQQQQQDQIDQEAMRALVGGTKAKRSKLEGIQIVDISDQDVLPDKDEWLRKNLAGETSFLPTGKLDEKGPTALAKRKHQISYLSMRAEKNMAELEAMWAANRQSNREGRSKYGF